MKHIIYLMAACLLLGPTSCQKYLDKDPIGIFTEEQVVQEPSIGTITGAVDNTYHILSYTLNLLGEWDWPNGLVFRNDFILQDLASGDANKKWSPDGDQPWMDDVASFNFTTENQAFNGIWVYNYEGISRVNQPIALLSDDAIIQQVGMSEAVRNRLLGEAYFLRAFLYFDLVVNFGDVPLILKPLTSFKEAYEVAVRAPKQDVWASIDSDLEKAVALLPSSKYSSETEKWRASKGAALALQAKSALYNERWTDVITKVNELQTLQYFDLNTNYFDNFAVAKEYTDDEVIFTYNHQPGLQPRRGNGITAILGWGFIAPSPDFVSSFEANDPRLNYTVNVDAKSVYKILGTTDETYKGNEDAPSNRIFIRWADVLLWKAEAMIQENDLAGGVGIINEIRARARNTPTISGGNTPPGTLPNRNTLTTSKSDALTWLMHERRVELGIESHRFSDLRRWKTAKTVLTAMGKNFTDRNYLYPIPQREVDKSAGSITQNDY